MSCVWKYHWRINIMSEAIGKVLNQAVDVTAEHGN